VGPFDYQPFLLPAGSALYFISNRAGSFNNSTDIYRAARGSTGQLDAPVQVSTVNTPSHEQTPVPTSDELVLYFASDRPDSPAKGGLDIWLTKRASPTDAFEPPVNVQELNTSGIEWVDWLSPDRCRIYFDRGGGTDNKAYVAERSM
jgi:hypothetical protein